MFFRKVASKSLKDAKKAFEGFGLGKIGRMAYGDAFPFNANCLNTDEVADQGRFRR